MGGVVPPGNPKTRKTPDQAARKSQSVDFAHLSDILTLFWLFHFFDFFHFFTFYFSVFSLFLFFDFVTFITFFIFHIFLFLCFLDFWSFFTVFLVFVTFWSFFVVKLGAPMMTHFSSSKPALPLSPLLVVKFHLIFMSQMLINFWSFLCHFLSIIVNFSEKLDFAIKNWHFSLIFDPKFHSFFTHFWPILGGGGGVTWPH